MVFRTTTMSKCERCGKTVGRSADPAFCVKCIRQMDDLMENSRGAGALLGRKEAPTTAKVYAFLDLFHPKMTHDQKMDIVESTKK